MSLRVTNIAYASRTEAVLPSVWRGYSAWPRMRLLAGASCAKRSTPAIGMLCSSSTPPRSSFPKTNQRIAARAQTHDSSVGDSRKPYREELFVMPPPGAMPLGAAPVVAGRGRARLVAAYFPCRTRLSAARAGTGRAVRDRIRDVPRLR